MNIVTPLIPVAAAALETVVEGVGSALQKGSSFASMLGGLTERDSIGQSSDTLTPADRAPNVSERSGQVQLDLLRQQLESLRQSVEKQLAERFSAAGIDLSEPAVVEQDADGRLLETSGHWDRAKIEQLLESDSSLRAAITQLFEQEQQLGFGSNGAARTRQIIVRPGGGPALRATEA